MTPADLQNLSQLLKYDGNESSSSDDELPRTGYNAMGINYTSILCSRQTCWQFRYNTRTFPGPGDIFQKVKITGNEVDREKNKISDDPKSIWRLSEVQEVPISDDVLWDPREKPQYDITYKQALKSEDIYLQVCM